MNPRRPLVSWLLLILLLAVAAPPAWADDASDARREFRAAMKHENWKERRTSLQMVLDYDDAKMFDVCLAAVLAEENAAVQLAGIKTLGQFESESARGALLAELARAKGEKAAVLLMALAEQKGHDGVEALIGLLADKDAQKAGLAALALGAKQAPQATNALIETLRHKELRVRSAAARALKTWAWSEKTKPAKNTGKLPEPKMPDWFELEPIQAALVGALKDTEGAARGDVIEALEFITRKDYGDNPVAWKAHLAGEEVTERMLRKRFYPPHFFGVPVWGERVVIVMDANVLTDRVHPFQDPARLQELCENPGRAGLMRIRIKSVKHFNDAWVRRFLTDLRELDGVKFDLILSSGKPKSVFGRLKPANAGTTKSAITEVEKADLKNDNDVLAAMGMALDIGGKKDSLAWTKGPDVVCCVYSSVPWLAEVTDAEVVGSAIGLKARRRLVKINAIGVHEFAYAMMELFAHQTGGTYRKLTQ